MAAEGLLDVRDLARTGLLESYRREGAEAWLTTDGGSMLPLIRPGSRVLVEFGARPVVGEVILFPMGGAYVAHRVVGRPRRSMSASLIVKGDAEPYPDRPIEPVEVLGVVRAVRWPQEAASRLAGLGGRSGRLIASTSLWSGRVARIGRRLATRGPRPIRGAGLRLIDNVARVPTRLAVAPLTRFGAEGR
jgi:hypothetical protein